MIEIRNELGDTLQLPLDETLTVEINSTIFETSDILQGSYSYPFSFSLKNDNNRKFIQNGHLPERMRQKVLSVTVVAGSITFAAKLKYQTDSLEADGALIIDLGAIANILRNTSLREFVTEEFIISTGEGGNPPSLSILAAAEPGRYPVVFPPFSNPDMIEEDFAPTSGYVRKEVHNFYDPSISYYPHTLLGGGDRLFVPFIYVNWLLRYIVNKLGFMAEGSFFADPELSRLTLFGTQSIPGNQGNYTVMIGRHLPDITIGSFLKAIRSYIGMTIDVDAANRRVVFNTYNSLRRSRDYVDLSPYYINNTQGSDDKGSGGYKVMTNISSSDKALEAETMQESFLVGESMDSTEISLEIGTTKMALLPITTEVDSPKWLIPRVQEPGNLADPFFETSDNYSPYIKANEPEIVPELKNSFGLRFLIYWGFKQDTAGRLYPYASSVSYDSKYRVFARLSLYPGEPDDIWNRYQEAYYEFLSYSMSVSAFLKLPSSVLSTISPSEKIGLRMNNLSLGLYLMERLSYELPPKEGYVNAKLECRQLIPSILKPNQPEENLYIGYWVQIVIENFRPEVNNPDLTIDRYADVAMYVWNDGEYTSPASDTNLIVNYKTETLTTDVNNVKETIFRKYNIRATGHKTMIATNVMIHKYRFIFPFPTFEYLYRVDWHAFAGRNYRLRLQ